MSFLFFEWKGSHQNFNRTSKYMPDERVKSTLTSVLILTTKSNSSRTRVRILPRVQKQEKRSFRRWNSPSYSSMRNKWNRKIQSNHRTPHTRVLAAKQDKHIGEAKLIAIRKLSPSMVILLEFFSDVDIVTNLPYIITRSADKWLPWNGISRHFYLFKRIAYIGY